MKSRHAITGVLLAVALLFTPVQIQTKAEESSDGKVIGPIICAVLVVGGIVVVGLYKLCKNVLPPSDPAPTPPSEPPPIIQGAQDGGAIGKILSLVDNSANYNIAASAIPDSYASVSGVKYHTLVTFSIESSTNLNQWLVEMKATGWVSDYGMFFAYYQNGRNVLNTYSLRSRTNFVPLNIGTGNEPQKFFRMRQ